MESPVYIKKEEDNGARIKSEEAATPMRERKKRATPVSTQIDVDANMTRANTGLSDLKSQYTQTTQFGVTNETNTAEIDRAIKEMENYIFHLYNEGEVTQTLFAYCNTIVEATRKWNTQITTQQRHMETYILNNITYKQELHALYAEVVKRQQKQKRDPSSPFNTMHTELETITLGNDNGALSSIF